MLTHELELIVWIAITAAALLVYFLPSISAVRARHRHAFMILVLNVLFGWTVFAWVALLVWSVNSDYLAESTTGHRGQRPAVS